MIKPVRNHTNMTLLMLYFLLPRDAPTTHVHSAVCRGSESARLSQAGVVSKLLNESSWFPAIRHPWLILQRVVRTFGYPLAKRVVPSGILF